MQKPAKMQDKYFLKSLHEEIDLYDRKLAHLIKYGPFPSAQEKQIAADKITAKRATLERTARALMAAGIEFRADDLPRSFRPPTADTQPASGIA